MKRFTFFYLLIFILSSNLAFSQKGMNNWYFGRNAGITFNSGAPVPLTDGELATDEGSASISDKDGNLLFYTDGTKVWDKTHNQMPNGSGLAGNISAAQSAIIIRKPGDDSTFYIITAFTSVHYTTVDLRLNGGSGGVVTAEKNIQMLGSSSEKVTAIKHANDLFYWVIVRNGVEYHAFLIDCDGVQLGSEVVSSPVGSASAETWGYMAASPDGSKLATAARAGGVQLADFDNATGVVSNVLTLQNPNAWPGATKSESNGNYGICFSPNSEVLYASSIGNGVLIQWDLTASPVDGSKALIAILTGVHANIGNTGYDYLGGALQLGPDGKIYITQFGKDSLAVINDPDVVGIGCNYQANAVFLGGKIVKLGLPNVTLPEMFDVHNKPAIYFDDAEACLDVPVSFTISNYTDVDSVKWNFGDPQSAENEFVLLPPDDMEHTEHIFNQLGTYNIRLVRFIDCVSDTIDTEITITRECALPITFASFDLKVKNSEVICSWVTASEINNEGFQIERSNDGINWFSIGFVKTKAVNGNSNNDLEYNFEDANPLNGKSYYRLKQTDIDGNYNYSLIRQADFFFAGRVSVYPNPTANQVRIEGLTEGEALQVYDMHGRLLSSRTIRSKSEVVSLQKYATGYYQIRITRKDGTHENFRVSRL